ncbi:MAG: DegV family protein [Anaerolineales bacterium]
MPEIGLVTDSTATIPQEWVQKYGIRVIPQAVIWEQKVLLDGVDITPDEFYERLKTASVMPTTSQASVAGFREAFEALVARNVPVLALVVSGKLSGTLQSAQQARALFPDARIEVVDSEAAAMALGFQVLAAARSAEKGVAFDDVVAAAREAKNHTGVLFAVETLEYLHRGGRIGGASRLLGTALNIKPVLELQAGRIEPVERVRTKSKAVARMLELVVERIAGRTPVRVSVIHAAAESEARDLLVQVKARLAPVESMITVASPAIGAHTGPGIVGLAYSAGL